MERKLIIYYVIMSEKYLERGFEGGNFLLVDFEGFQEYLCNAERKLFIIGG